MHGVAEVQSGKDLVERGLLFDESGCKLSIDTYANPSLQKM
jgi:hypothetical protein